MARVPRVAWLGVATAGLAAVGAGDLASGPELSFSLFYVLPISLAAWAAGRIAGTAAAAAGAGIWLAADRLAGTEYSASWIAVWNSAIRLGFFLIIATLVSRARTSLETEQRLARTDALTGIRNGPSFVEAVAEELARARRYGRPVAVAFVDVDDFKSVNDRQGHHAGDALLRGIAGALASHIRATDVVGRMGGDEFAVLLPETGRDGALTAARKLMGAASAVYPGGISIGVATCTAAPDSADDLIRAADGAMYAAKARGKGRIEYVEAGPGLTAEGRPPPQPSPPAPGAGERRRARDEGAVGSTV